MDSSNLAYSLNLSSMPGMEVSIGNYTLDRSLWSVGWFQGLILGDVTCYGRGCPSECVYIALVTPGGTVSADGVPSLTSGVPSCYLVCTCNNITDEARVAAIGATVGTIGTSSFYGTATMNLVWQHIGWKPLKEAQKIRSWLGLDLTSSSLSFQQ